MSKLKLNNSDNYESFEIFLDEQKHPIAFNNKLQCLMSSGMSEEQARKDIATIPFELELYYEIGAGLMAVESGAVECGTIYSPYTGELYEEYDEWE